MFISKMKMEEKEIPSLIRKGKSNEVIAFLYKILFPKVKGYIMKQRGRKEDASDVFQDALLFFYKQVMEGTFNEKYTVYGYVYKLALNRWLNKIKKDQKLSLPGELEETADENIEKEFVELDVLLKGKNSLDKIFEKVGEKCREILIYTICYDLMLQDVMLRMGFASEGAVKMQVKRCKEKLYKAVQENPALIKSLREG